MDINALRKAAKLQLGKAEAEGLNHSGALTPEASQRLIHELQTHQIELEMQNEALQTAQLELVATRDDLKKLYDYAPVGYLSLDTKGIIKKANLSFLALLCMDRAAVLGKPLNRFIHKKSQDTFYLSLLALSKSLDHQSVEVCFLRDQDETQNTLWARIDCEPELEQGGQLYRINLSVTDITVQHQASLKLEHQAFYDALTDLPNRQLFLNRFNQHLHKVKRTGLFGALLYLDVDDFKFINDSFGHSVGDEILKHISLILTQKIRASDTAARFGGDEFLVLLTDLSDNQITAGIEAEAIARKIYAKLLESFTFKERPFRIEVSIGIALFPDKHATVDDIICEADIAMYRNKTKMKGINQTHDPVAMFDKDEHRLVKDRLYTYQCLRDALTNDEFFLEYQPQVDIDQNIKGAECLIRWKPINEGVVSPAAFIPILEDGSLIIDVGEWVLTEACHVLSTWNDQSDYFAQLTLAVNISALQFNADDFPERVMAILNSTGANPHRLVLEITESMSIKDLKRTVDKMNKLKDIGVSFSIDDFGTGYSSLTYIKKLPIDTLKIDRSFVRNVHEDSDNEVFVNLFMQMAKNFNFSVVVEGVETSSELTVLLNNGCDVFQGFYFSKPLSLKDLEAFCQETDKDFVGTL